MPGSFVSGEERRALLQAQDPELGKPTKPVTDVDEPAEESYRRGANWRDTYFSTWRSVFLYRTNCDFAECFEISFRGAIWLVLWGSPAIWGLDKDPESLFYRGSLIGKVFQTGAIVSFVYTLAPTIGITLNYAVHGVAGTLVAATYSLLMYLVFPDGCSGAEAFSLCYAFGAVAGVVSIVCCLLLNVGASFQVFYCANFVWFWLAFMNPDSPQRTAPEFPKEQVLGFEFADWGGGVFDGVIKMISGASLAVLVTLLPYPMTSMEQARDSAADIVNVLGKTWASSVDFYLGNEKDERNRARMLSSMRAIKGHMNTFKEHLEGSWWEMFFVGRCSRAWRSNHLYLSELEATTSRCFERLTHVIDACAREQFEDVHDEMMGRCGHAVKVLTKSANDLLKLAATRADDGSISQAEQKELKDAVTVVQKAEVALSRVVRKAVDDIHREQAKPERQQALSKSREDLLNDTAEMLTDEQIFMFSLCDFACSVREYSTWLAEHGGIPPYFACSCLSSFKNMFDRETVMATTNLNFAARTSLAMFIGFAIGYVGYSEIIPSKDATIPCTVAVLLSHSLSSPVSKSLGRLQGVVLGKFYGKLAYALLGWCFAWAQVSLSVVLFSYVWLALFIYHYTSSFSYLGCLAAAFGTQAFLLGCDNDTPVHANGGPIVNMLVAIGITTIIDTVLRIGRPSELAFGAYLDAWAAWDHVLQRLLTTEDTTIDPVQINTLINQAEALANEAASEPRLWRTPFPSDLFSEMVGLARIMRTQVICIHTVVCEPSQNDDGTFSKKDWFKRLLENGSSGWPDKIAEVLEEMDNTHVAVERLEKANGEKIANKIVKIKRTKTVLESKREKLRLSKSILMRSLEEDDLKIESLVQDPEAQKNFVYGCLQSIFQVNYNLQLEMIKRGVA